MKTPNEIKKGLEYCNNGDCENCPYRERKIDCADVLREDTLAYIRQLEEREWDLFDLLSSAWFRKACYFKQNDGAVYSRVSGEYMAFDQAIDEFAGWLSYDGTPLPESPKEDE